MATQNDAASPKIRASLRIFGDSIDPEAISSYLGLLSDHQHRVGDPIGSGQEHTYKHNMWILKSKAPPEASLEVHLDDILTRVESKQLYLRSLAEHATVDFYCVVFWNNGFQLGPQTLSRMAGLGATFGVVVYPDDSGTAEPNEPDASV